MKNVIVYKENGRFAGWPANYGIWSWGDEIVVGFLDAYFEKREQGHAWDPSKPKFQWQGRSLDGGETWTIDKPEELTPFTEGGEAPEECPGNINFTDPDFAMTCRRTGDSGNAKSWFYYSTNRCDSWNGPYIIPDFGQQGIAARTDYLVLNQKECLVFLTAIKPDGCEGRPFCALLKDGGKTWEFLSWIGPEPKGFTIMPSSIRLPNGDIITALRRKEGSKEEGTREFWIETYISKDNGKAWEFLSIVVDDMGGNPPSMILLDDGRLSLTYGYRCSPFGIRAKLSEDEGKTWGETIILRDDGGNGDLGYPQTVQRPDGKIVTVYYFNDHADKERYIAATIWSVNQS